MSDLQAVMTAPELALQLRKLDSNIQWEALKRPLGEDFPYASAEILDRRPAVSATDAAAPAGSPQTSSATAAASAAAASAAAGTSPASTAAASATTGWEYLLQLSHGEALPDGISPAQRLPLQPLTQPVDHLRQPSRQLQQPHVHSDTPDLPSSSAPAQTFQNGIQSVLHSEQQQQQMSVLPNDALVQQHQQAAGSPVDKQIAVQQAVSMASLEELPEQAQLAPQTANALPAGEDPAGPATDDITADPSSADVVATNPAISNSAQREAQHPISAAHNLPFGSLQPISAFQHGPAPLLSASNGMPRASTLLASLVPAVQQRPLSAGAASATASGHYGSAQPQGFVKSPAFSREGTPAAKPPPTWVNGDKLPLWLVKAFEEKRRRDVSMVAARAAQQAQRDANAANRGVFTKTNMCLCCICMLCTSSCTYCKTCTACWSNMTQTADEHRSKVCMCNLSQAAVPVSRLHVMCSTMGCLLLCCCGGYSCALQLSDCIKLVCWHKDIYLEHHSRIYGRDESECSHACHVSIACPRPHTQVICNTVCALQHLLQQCPTTPPASPSRPSVRRPRQLRKQLLLLQLMHVLSVACCMVMMLSKMTFGLRVTSATVGTMGHVWS